LDTSIPYGDSDYFYTLVEAMVGAGGVRNVSIRGSPYDFRFAPSSVYYGSWLAKMTRLVEETYLINQNYTKRCIGVPQNFMDLLISTEIKEECWNFLWGSISGGT